MRITKKSLWLLVLSLVASLTFCILSGCSFGGDNGEVGDNSSHSEESSSIPSEQTTYVEISPAKLTMDVYEQYTLQAILRIGADYVFKPAVWSASDTSVASVTADGVVFAVSEGTTTVTATIDGYTNACEVRVVASGAKAYLALADSEINIREEESKRISAVVRYKGMSYTDATFTYTVDDKSVATVSSSGVLKAIKYGSTKVTVRADWRGLTGEEAANLTADIDINVKDSIYATIEDKTYVVYQRDTEIEGEHFSNTANLDYTLIRAGSDVTADATLNWYSDDESIVRIENGKLYGVRAGETEVYCSYVSEKGDEYFSNTVPVRVIFPVLDKTELSFTIERSTVLTGREVFGKNIAIEYIECDGVSVSTQNPGAIDFEKVENGSHVITVYNDEYGYKVNAFVCTKVLKTINDIIALQYHGTNVGTGMLYALGNDIDGKGVTIKGASYGWSQNTGFQGEIDGRGHTVSNIIVGSCGIFGTLGKAKIHDLNFTGVTLLAQWRTALLAATCYNSTLENISVTFKDVGIPIHQETGKTDECGLLVARQTAVGVMMRNITLNAQGLTIPCVLGYGVGEITLVNYTVNAKEVVLLGTNQQWATDVLEIDLPGVTVNDGLDAPYYKR